MVLPYLTPFAFLALAFVGACLGGLWTWAAAVATLLSLATLDWMLGDDKEERHRASARTSRWLPKVYIVLQLAVMARALAFVARPTATAMEFAGLAVSLGVTMGVFGFLAAHEMIHSPDPRERALGLIMLASVFYMHFRIVHVYGHHRRAATADDPASASLGESLYAFLPRAIAGQFREAWTFEAQRLRRRGRAVLGWGNRMVLYIVIQAALLLAIGLMNLRALAFVAIVAAISVCLLESFNYVAHYGLRRRKDANGRIERLGLRHSWNATKRMNNAALFNMGRHSDHHRIMTRRYDELEPLEGAAQLPSGYAAALMMALIPLLWRRVMDPRVAAVMSA